MISALRYALPRYACFVHATEQAQGYNTANKLHSKKRTASRCKASLGAFLVKSVSSALGADLEA